jgi:hypothetical protein
VQVSPPDILPAVASPCAVQFHVVNLLLHLIPRSLALCMFGTPDFADKFPTQQEKLLAFFERIEIG